MRTYRYQNYPSKCLYLYSNFYVWHQKILSLICLKCLVSRSMLVCFLAIFLIIMAVFFGTILGSHQGHLAILVTLPS